MSLYNPSAGVPFTTEGTVTHYNRLYLHYPTTCGRGTRYLSCRMRMLSNKCGKKRPRAVKNSEGAPCYGKVGI